MAKKNYDPLDAKEERAKRIQQSKLRMDQIRKIASVYTFQNPFYTVYEQRDNLLKQLLELLKIIK